MKNCTTKIGKAWAWLIPSGQSDGYETVCNYAHTDKQSLLSLRKPHPSAKAISVAIVPMLIWKEKK